MAEVKTPMTHRLIQTLLLIGPMTYEQLAKQTGLTTIQVADTMRRAVRFKEYGIYVYGKAGPSEVNIRQNIMAIDIDEYNQYIRAAKPRARNGSQIKEVATSAMPKRPVIEQRKITPPITAYKTTWQSSSPYRTTA